jgi:hypothetical protein
MTEAPPHPTTSDDRRGRRPTGGTPRWVKAFGVIALVAVLLIVVLLMSGGSSHGPGRHAPSGEAGSKASGSDNERRGAGGRHKPPEGGHAP